MNSIQAQQQQLEQALHYHGSGNLQEAEKLYRGLLEQQPDHPDALHYLGVIGLQVGRADEAVGLIQRAVDARPDYVDAIVNLGNAFLALGQPLAAVEQFRHAQSLAPATAPLHANLGGALQQAGRNEDAIKQYKAALEMQPELAEVRRSLADALFETGQPQAALAEITQAAAAAPPSLAMQVSLGNILHAAGRTDEAIRCFEDLLRVQPDLVQVRGNLANILRQTGQLEKAVAEYMQVLEHDPNYVEAHRNLGLAYQDLGDKEKALAAYRKAVSIDPKCAKAWFGISAVSKPAFTDEEVAVLVALQDDADASDDDRMRLGFALGKHFENSGNHKDAAAQYLLANPLQRAVFDYDFANDVRTFESMRKRVNESFLEKWRDAGSSDSTPIFIVGMPRSGTTLVEQILACHTRVTPAGELTLLARSIIDTFPVADGADYTGPLATATAADFEKIAGQYLGGLPKGDSDFVTDKLPHNFLNVGMIRVLFPNATIIHCRRDPRDTCFSIYKNLFGAYGHFYAYDLEELGHYYNEYAKLMAHWERIMPGVMHNIDYETMVDNQEEETRRLLAACNLEWDPACLEFYKHKRPVATISASQVRQPVYRGSIAAWQPYEDMLRPLIDILESA